MSPCKRYELPTLTNHGKKTLNKNVGLAKITGREGILLKKKKKKQLCYGHNNLGPKKKRSSMQNRNVEVYCHDLLGFRNSKFI